MKNELKQKQETRYGLRIGAYVFVEIYRKSVNNFKIKIFINNSYLTIIDLFSRNYRKTSNLPYDISDVIEEAEKELVQESNETEIQIEMEIESADPSHVNKDNNSTAIYKEIDEDLILIEQPVELIVIDEDDDNGKSEKQFKISDSMKKLVQQIKTYPELYDSDNVVYNDYSHRSNIWNSIATFLGDKGNLWKYI